MTGLMRTVSGYQIRTLGPPEIPFGWRKYREFGYDRWLIMPLWIYLPRRVWDRRWAPVEWLIRLGVLQCDEGDYYRTARPLWLYRAVWCFLHDADRAP